MKRVTDDDITLDMFGFLPVELLLELFVIVFPDTETDKQQMAGLYALRRVSQRVRDIIDGEIFGRVREMTISKKGQISKEALSLHTNLERLLIGSSSYIVIDDKCLSNFKKLNYLRIPKLCLVRGECFSSLAALHHLSVSQPTPQQARALRVLGRHLKSLTLEDNSEVYDYDLFRMSTLERLTLIRDTCITGECLKEMPLLNYVSLVNSPMVKELDTAPALVSLNIESSARYYRHTFFDADLLKMKKTLKNLSFVCNTVLTGAALQKMRSLECLRLHKEGKIKGSDIAKLVKLKRLSLIHCDSRIGTRDILPKLAQNLSVLELSLARRDATHVDLAPLLEYDHLESLTFRVAFSVEINDENQHVLDELKKRGCILREGLLLSFPPSAGSL